MVAPVPIAGLAVGMGAMTKDPGRDDLEASEAFFWFDLSGFAFSGMSCRVIGDVSSVGS
jgi:hypothetical protein